jgi:excisionase family DNA binding protein
MKPRKRSDSIESTGSHERATLSIAEAAKRLGLTESATRKAAASGQLQTIRFGRRWLVLKAPLDALLASGAAAEVQRPPSAAARRRKEGTG